MAGLAGVLLAGGAAASPLSAFASGDLVVSVEGNGSGGAATGSSATGNTGADTTKYLDNQAAPLTLYEYTPAGTASASFAGSLTLPTVTSGSNSAIAGEYGSSSEGTLQLTGNGKYLTIMGYGVNPAAYNSTFDVNGAGTALAQSCSLSSCGASAVSRVIATIGANAKVNTSTTLLDVFNENNPRSVYSADGTSFYISGQGNDDDTGGVFYVPGLGSHTATPITGNDTADKSGNPFAQDTRTVQIYDGTLYVSTDTKEGSGHARDFIGTLGTPPATSLVSGGTGPTMLPGFGNSGGTGKLKITAGNNNGINAKVAEVNLSPENFFFANPATLYVADGGIPKNDSATSDKGGSGLGDGGLQKWSLVGGSWVLDYTLSSGLGLVANTAASGTTGLLGLTGEVETVDGVQVAELFATSFTIGDTDPTFLYGITDVLSDLTLPSSEMFDVLATAPADADFKGVSFAPTGAVPEPSSLAAMMASLLALGFYRRRRG